MANEARLNLVISARDEAKAVIESFATSIKETFTGLQEEISRTFNMASVEQSFRMISDSAMLTRTSVEESLNGMKQSTDALSQSITEAADRTTQGFRTMAEGINSSSTQIEQDVEQIGQASQHMSESLDFMNLQMAGQMIQEFGHQITGFFEGAVHSAADFDQNIVNTTASLDANMGVVKLNTQQIQAMQDAAIKMGESGFFSANQVADAMNTMSKQGITYQQIMSGGIDTVYKVAAANQADLESTANVVSDIYNEMGDMFKKAGMSAQDASQLIGNSMTVALHHARISMDDFMTTMKYVGPQAASMGIGIKDVSAAIALLGEHGIRSSQAGTTLRRMLTNLQPASKDAGHWMHQLGMLTKDNANIFYDSAGKMKPLAEVQQILHDKISTLNPEMQQQAIKAIFGQYALSGMTAIVNTAPSKYQALTDAMNNNNVMTDIMNEKSKGLGMEIQRLNAHWQTVQKTIGEALKPIVESLIGVLNNLMKMWEGLNPHVKQAIIVFGAVTGVVLLVGGSLLALIGTVGMFATAWEAGVEVLGAIIAPAGIVIGIIAGIVVAVAGLVYAWNHDLGGIQTKTKEVFSFISQAFNGLKDMWSGNGGKGISILDNLGFSTDAILAIQITFDRIKEGVQQVEVAFGKVKSFVQGVFMILSGTGGGKGIDILQKLGFSKSTISDLMKMGGQFQATFNSIKTSVSSAVSQISSIIRQTFSGILTFWNTHQAQIRQSSQQAWNAIGNVVRTAISIIVPIIQYFTSNILPIISRVFKDVLSTGVQAFGGLVKAIGSALTTVFAWWNQYWPEMQTSFTTIWKIMLAVLIPTIASMTIMISAALGFIKGAWSNGWKAIVDILKMAWDLIKGATEIAWHALSGIISVVLDLLSGNFRKAGSDFVNIFKNIFNDIKSTFSSFASDAFNFGVNFVKMLASGITSAVGSVVSAVSGVADKIKGFLGFHSPTETGPASDSDVWAPNFVNMMAKGIQDHTPKIQAAVNGIALSMKTGVTSVSHNVSQNQISIPSTRANQAQTVINIQIDGRSTKTDNDLAEIIAHKLYRQMPVVS